jgi:hypothetical protein
MVARQSDPRPADLFPFGLSLSKPFLLFGRKK